MKLHIGHYGRLRDMDVEFSPGLNIVTGENGAGKSTLLEALLWSFYGDARVRLADAQVESEWEGINAFRSVEGGRSTFMLTLDGKRYSGVREGASVLEDSGFPNLKLLLATVWSKQGELGFLSLSPLDRRRFLSEILELRKWDDVRTVVKKRLTAVEKEVSKLQGQLESNAAERERKVNLVEQLEPMAKIAKTTPEPELPPKVDELSLERLYREQKEIEEKISRRDDLYREIPDAVPEYAFDSARENVSQCEDALKQLESQSHQIVGLEGELGRAVKAEETLAGIPCRETSFPYHCKFVQEAAASVLDIDAIRKRIEELSSSYKSEKTKWSERLQEAREQLSELEAKRDKRREVEAAIGSIRAAESRLPGIADEIARLKSLAKQRSPEKVEEHKRWKESSRYLLRLQVAESDLIECEMKEVKLRKQIENLEVSREHLSQMDKDFSPKGVPGYIVENALPQLAESANEYLMSFSEGYSVRFSMIREKATGGTSETLDILVSRGGDEVPVEACSGGERVMVDIAIRMALRDFITMRGVHLPDVLVLDETLAPLDESNRVRFMQSFLSSSDFGRVIMISHVPDVRELPGNVISL